MQEPSDPMEAAALPFRIASRIRVDQETGCWIWVASSFINGYGRAYWNGHVWLAHRLIYTLLVGPIPDDRVLDHLCQKRACVRPSCLEPVTMVENSRRSGLARRQKVCSKGHQRSLDDKRCQECHKQYDRKRLADPEFRQRKQDYDRRLRPRRASRARKGKPGPDQQRLC